ncbi:semaphorin-2A-like [Aphidius gifuensis]|uniref:semaphorin-2A-like n=1 Tax=Aphidius gifuensis TaxID=684658 RepID=UPI001CDC2214|nr:semaphorin-2A-like [Aphidius gifuensis]
MYPSCPCDRESFFNFVALYKYIPRYETVEVETHNNYLKTFYLDENDDNLYVGGEDWIYKLDSKNISNLKQEFQLKANNKDADSRNPKYHNHIKAIHPFRDYLFVCGTNGNQPQGWILMKNFNLTNDKIHWETKNFGSDYENSVTSVIVKNDDENMQLYFATSDSKTDFVSIILSNLSIKKNTQSIEFKSPLSEYTKFRSPTTFIGSFVIGNEILFFFTERAYEKNNQEFLMSEDTFKKHSREYGRTFFSRVARICKEDSDINGTNWRTFIKARLACSTTINNELVHFNKLKSIYAIPKNDEYFYALFTEKSSGKPSGYSGICKFSKFEIKQAFNSSFKERIDDTNQTKDKIQKPNSCGKNLQHNQSSTNDYTLVESVINATSIWGFLSDDFETLVVDRPNKLPGFENISCTNLIPLIF